MKTERQTERLGRRQAETDRRNEEGDADRKTDGVGDRERERIKLDSTACL